MNRGGFALYGEAEAREKAREARLAQLRQRNAEEPEQRKNAELDAKAKADNAILVFDGVFESSVSETLEDSASGSAFQRPPQSAAKAPQSAAEFFIESILDAVGDTGKEVEFWSQEMWQPVEMHRACDAGAASLGARRFPARVYIAYLDLEPGLVAPTVLWTPNGAGTFAKLVAVPAVTGRLLSFDGELLQAVPRPAGQFFGTPDPEWSTAKRRRVLVIKTWADHASEAEAGGRREGECVGAAMQPSQGSSGRDLEELEEELAVPYSGDSGGGARPAGPSCLPRGQWQATPLNQWVDVSDSRVVDDDDPREPPAYSFSVSAVGSEDDFVTTLASIQGGSTMMEAPHTPAWLPTTLARGAFNAANLRIGVPSAK